MSRSTAGNLSGYQIRWVNYFLLCPLRVIVEIIRLVSRSFDSFINIPLSSKLTEPAFTKISFGQVDYIEIESALHSIVLTKSSKSCGISYV